MSDNGSQSQSVLGQVQALLNTLPDGQALVVDERTAAQLANLGGQVIGVIEDQAAPSAVPPAVTATAPAAPSTAIATAPAALSSVTATARAVISTVPPQPPTAAQILEQLQQDLTSESYGRRYPQTKWQYTRTCYTMNTLSNKSLQ